LCVNEVVAAQDQIRHAAARFLAQCARASESQWVFRLGPAVWSMAQVTEHVAISNRNIHRMLTKRLLGSPIDGRATGVLDVEIPYLFYRGDEPPNVATPTGDWTDRKIAAEAFDESARALLEWAGAQDSELRAVGLEHPVFGLLDGVQWLLFAAAHMERHRAQLIGLAAHRGAPA
jgi:uncharacterized damage-inducible protein DinB